MKGKADWSWNGVMLWAMMILIFLIVLIVLCMTVFVQAASVVVYPLSLGYNVSFHVSQISGNFSPISFDGCVNTVSKADWFCDLHNSPNFNLTLRSDNKFLQHERVFEITSSGVSCQPIFFNDTRIVSDFGSFAYVSGGSMNLGKEVVQVPIYIKVNDTRYVNQTVYVPEYHNTTIYVNTSWENTSKIEELNKSINYIMKEWNTANDEINTDRRWIVGEGIIIVFILTLCVYSWKVKK